MSSMRPHDRRHHPRLDADTLAFLSAQVSGGARVRLIDVSHGGVRLETPQHMRPGQTLAVRFSIDDDVLAVTARVVRATVTSVEAESVSYETALELLEGPRREQFRLTLASRGRAALDTAADASERRSLGLDVVLIDETETDEATGAAPSAAHAAPRTRPGRL